MQLQAPLERMTSIPTVRGFIETSHLGATLMHEHIFVLNPEIMLTYPEASAQSWI
jgi:phosphotriesterase-related protein